MTNNTYKNCEIIDVYQKVVGNVGRMNHFLVEVKYTLEGNVPKFIDLKIDKSNMSQKNIKV